MKIKFIILGMISGLVLISCDIRGPDILSPVQETDNAKIIGMRLDPPSEVTFYTDREMTEEEKKLMTESFLAALVIPEKDLWVNLRIEQPKRIAPYSLGVTELGRVMLEQDYILKKSVATVVYPLSDSGRRFWTRMSFCGPGVRFELRTWIFPKEALIADNGREMLIKEAELDVSQEKLFSNAPGFEEAASEIILPEVRRYVRESGEFASTRQIYRAVICAIWFKNKFPSTIYRYYINTHKTGGFEISDKDMKYKVFEQYAYIYRNKCWRMYNGQNWGGIDFKSPANWMRVEKEDVSERLQEAHRFTVALSPSDVPSSSGEGEPIRGKLGGIDLNARIEVEEEPFTVSEDTYRDWQFSQGIGYIFVE